MSTPTRGDWTTLAADVALPTDFAAALMTSRPEILRQIRRPLDAAETEMVAHAMGVLLQTNHDLQERIRRVHARLEQLGDNADGVGRAIARAAEYLETGDEDMLSARAATHRDDD